MIETKEDVENLLRPGKRPISPGITRYSRDQKMVIEVEMLMATFNGKKWMDLNNMERKNLDDLLYLSNIHEADVRIKYV